MTNILHANFMNEFTKNINLISDIDLWNTPNNLHCKLWNYINQLSHFKNKLELIENWEYKDAFLYAEQTHENGQYIFHNMSWEDSFVLTFMYRYHFYNY